VVLKSSIRSQVLADPVGDVVFDTVSVSDNNVYLTEKPSVGQGEIGPGELQEELVYREKPSSG